MEPAQGEGTLSGVAVETDDRTGLALRVAAVRLGPLLGQSGAGEDGPGSTRAGARPGKPLVRHKRPMLTGGQWRSAWSPKQFGSRKRNRSLGPTVVLPQHRSASAVLRGVIDGAEGESITIGEIVGAFGERAFGFVLILFSLPNCVPAPPGVAIVGPDLRPADDARPQAALAAGIHPAPERVGRDVQAPHRRRGTAPAKARGVLQTPSRRAFRPVRRPVIGLFAFLVALSVLIPFPGTNFPPSIARDRLDRRHGGGRLPAPRGLPHRPCGTRLHGCRNGNGHPSRAGRGDELVRVLGSGSARVRHRSGQVEFPNRSHLCLEAVRSL